MKRELQLTHERVAKRRLRQPNASVPGHLTDFGLNRRQQAIRGTLHLLHTLAPPVAAYMAAALFLRPRRRSGTYTDQLPPGARRLQIIHNRQKLTAYSWGDGDRTILLLHGWESHSGRMFPLVTPLVQSGLRVVTLDAPGHGQSPGLLTDMHAVGEAVRSSLAQLAPVYGIVANSFGAAAAMTMLARYPDMQPSRIALISPMIQLTQHLDLFDQIVDIGDRLQTDMRQIIQARMPYPIAEFDVAQAVTRIKRPGLIIHDREDPVIPFQSACRVADLWDGVTLMQTCQLGHKKVIRSIAVQAALVDFFRDSPGAACPAAGSEQTPQQL